MKTNLIAAILFLVLTSVSLIAATLGTSNLNTMFPSAVGVAIPVNEPITIAVGTYALDTNPALTTGTGKAFWVVPSCYDSWYIQSMQVYACTASSSGLPTFQITNVSKSHYCLDKLCTIDAGEWDSKDANVASSLYSQYKIIYSGDMLRVDCSVAGTGTKQVQARLVIQPNP